MKIPSSAVLAAAAALGLVLYSRSAKAAAPSTASAPRRPVTGPGRLEQPNTYANPQNMAELLARSVNTAFGIFSPLPRTVAATVGTAEQRAAIRASESPGYYGWQGPTISSVQPDVHAQYSGDAYWAGNMADSVPVGMVYDVGTDLVVEPWAVKATADNWLDGWGT